MREIQRKRKVIFVLDDKKGFKIVDGIRYANMMQAARYLGYSPMGWRKLRDSLVKQGKIVLHRFEDNVYILEIDLELLKIQEKGTI
jgi:hypothetical protein